jgi:peptidylprolyl isomerase
VLPHVTVGSRVEIVTPPAGAFGANGATSYGITGKDDLIYVLDVVGAYGPTMDITGTQPAQTERRAAQGDRNPGQRQRVDHHAPRRQPAGHAESKVLIQGSGAPITKNQRLMVQYTGVDWNTGKQFDSSFARKQIASYVFGSNTVISGWNTGLAGAHVGDRILLIVPPRTPTAARACPRPESAAGTRWSSSSTSSTR